jgi:hypothetical protein
LAVRKKEKGKQETGIVIHSWKQSNQHKPLVKIQSAQVVKIQSAPTMLGHQHRDNWLERWWAGSIPKALIEHSPCSVLVVIIK